MGDYAALQCLLLYVTLCVGGSKRNFFLCSTVHHVTTSQAMLQLPIGMDIIMLQLAYNYTTTSNECTETIAYKNPCKYRLWVRILLNLYSI